MNVLNSLKQLINDVVLRGVHEGPCYCQKLIIHEILLLKNFKS